MTPVFGIGVGEIGLLLAVGNVLTGVVQVAYAPLQRIVSRRSLLGIGGLVFGAAMTATGLATSWGGFSLATIGARVAGSPQHPVGNALIAEQRHARAHASAIAVHIAGGNLGTVAVPLVGAWIIASFGWPVAMAAVGLPAVVVGALILVAVRESGADRAAAVAHGSVRRAFADVLREPDLRRLFAASSIAAAGRGIGVVSTFVPLYLARSLDLDAGTVALMYTLLLAGSVPGPLLAGRLAGRYGHRAVLAWLVRRRRGRARPARRGGRVDPVSSGSRSASSAPSSSRRRACSRGSWSRPPRRRSGTRRTRPTSP